METNIVSTCIWLQRIPSTTLFWHCVHAYMYTVYGFDSMKSYIIRLSIAWIWNGAKIILLHVYFLSDSSLSRANTIKTERFTIPPVVFCPPNTIGFHGEVFILWKFCLILKRWYRSPRYIVPYDKGFVDRRIYSPLLVD